MTLGCLYEMACYLFLCYLFWVLEQKPHHNNVIILVLPNFQIAFTCISSYDSYIAVKKTELFSPDQPATSPVLGYIYCLIHDDCQLFFNTPTDCLRDLYQHSMNNITDSSRTNVSCPNVQIKLLFFIVVVWS